jgi:predicted DNA-binding ribbon-helix-helix protein
MTQSLRRRPPPATPRDGSGVIKRSLTIAGHATSISLEEPFWAELKSVAKARGMSLASLVGEIDGSRGRTNLSSALRVHVLETVQSRATVLPGQSAGPKHD